MDKLAPKDGIYIQFASFGTEKCKIWSCLILVEWWGDTQPVQKKQIEPWAHQDIPDDEHPQQAKLVGGAQH